MLTSLASKLLPLLASRASVEKKKRGSNLIRLLQSSITKSQKKHFKNEMTYRDGIPKKHPNKVGMTPQYFYGFPSLYDWMLDCDVYILWRFSEPLK